MSCRISSCGLLSKGYHQVANIPPGIHWVNWIDNYTSSATYSTEGALALGIGLSKTKTYVSMVHAAILSFLNAWPWHEALGAS